MDMGSTGRREELEDLEVFVDINPGGIWTLLSECQIVGENGDKYVVQTTNNEDLVEGTVSIQFVEEMLRMRENIQNKDFGPKSWVFD